MQPPSPIRKQARPGEEGYILLAVIFLTIMVLITLSVAAPRVAKDIERDREVELMHRGKQFQRAIQLYYRKFNAYPPTMEALEKTNNIRFLRKRYKDPVTGKDEWHLIHFGEAKTQTLGFFGQPIAGAGMAGASMISGIGPVGGNAPQGGLFGGNPTDPNAANQSGLTNQTAQPNQPSQPSQPNQASSIDPNAANNGAATPNPTDNSGAAGSGTVSSGGFGSQTTASTGLGANGQTFGGGGIIGVESTSPKLAILEYKKKKHFNEWEFVYDPISERMGMAGGNTGQIGQPIGNSTTGVGQPNSGFGSNSGGINNGGNGTGITPTPPVQQ